jgi:anaerobic selenocysteine-containing dehydrogenase
MPRIASCIRCAALAPRVRPIRAGSGFPGTTALDLVAGKMRAAMTKAPLSLAFGVATPSGTAVADSFAWIHRLAHACHSPNLVFATENCNWHKDFAPAYTFGAGIGMPDYQQTGCILLWGFNPATSWLAQATAVRQAQKRGARLIVVDPRRAGLAAAADLWLRPHPGSDGALALGLGPFADRIRALRPRLFYCAGAIPPSWWQRTMAAR